MNIHELVEKYTKDRDTYLSTSYNETQLRNDFIDPLLKCFGWDVDNDKNSSHLLRDVIQEEYITVAGEASKKNPDYTLRVNGIRKIFVEVKKPSIDILSSSRAAFQTRRYGWSANLGISILTNFEHIVIYDCRHKPLEGDSEVVARYKIYDFTELSNAYEDIYKLISYDSAFNGILDELFAIDKHEGVTFDEYFLSQIESWREKLAESAIMRNRDLNEEDANYVIQRILNRIIFLRICEDRSIEEYETVRNMHDYDDLKALFELSDTKFNSGLFACIDDALTSNVIIDSDVLCSIFEELYFPQSPYDFSVVDPTILSQIYERFLGRTVSISEGRVFEMQESPEVSASNGVVPTPRIIVEKIVKDTLSPLVDPLSLEEIWDLKIADICCGSGTFLISAYDYILSEITKRIDLGDTVSCDMIAENVEVETKLSLRGKRKILEKMLYGVDINPYAVEVTKFSLLLKILEDENEATVNTYISKYSSGALPNLKANIKCGNSLVDNLFFSFMPDAVKDSALLYKVKPFEWATEFPKLFPLGGFDAIIGNPPYVRIQNMKKYISEEIQYYQSSICTYEVAKVYIDSLKEITRGINIDIFQLKLQNGEPHVYKV